MISQLEEIWYVWYGMVCHNMQLEQVVTFNLHMAVRMQGPPWSPIFFAREREGEGGRERKRERERERERERDREGDPSECTESVRNPLAGFSTGAACIDMHIAFPSILLYYHRLYYTI